MSESCPATKLSSYLILAYLSATAKGFKHATEKADLYLTRISKVGKNARQ